MDYIFCFHLYFQQYCVNIAKVYMFLRRAEDDTALVLMQPAWSAGSKVCFRVTASAAVLGSSSYDGAFFCITLRFTG